MIALPLRAGLPTTAICASLFTFSPFLSHPYSLALLSYQMESEELSHSNTNYTNFLLGLVKIMVLNSSLTWKRSPSVHVQGWTNKWMGGKSGPLGRPCHWLASRHMNLSPGVGVLGVMINRRRGFQGHSDGVLKR